MVVGRPVSQCGGDDNDHGSGGGGGESTSSSGSTEITVHPVCWHEPDLSGVDMAKKYTDKGLPDRWDDPAVRSGAVHSFAPMYYTEHADDPDGRWYKGTCDVSYAVDSKQPQKRS